MEKFDERLIKAQYAAKLMNITPSTFAKWIETGKVKIRPVVFSYKSKRYRLSDVINLTETSEEEKEEMRRENLNILPFYMSVRFAASILDVSTVFLYPFAHNGELATVKMNGKTRVTKPALYDFVERYTKTC